MFLQSLAYPDWPLNSIQLHLASAKTAEHTHLGNPVPHPENQLQASTDLQWALGTGQGRAGRSLCRVAWLCLGKLLGGKRKGRKTRTRGREVCPGTLHQALSAPHPLAVASFASGERNESLGGYPAGKLLQVGAEEL